MKWTDFSILFVCLAVAFTLPLDQRFTQLMAQTRRDVVYNQRFDNAIDDAIYHLVEVDTGNRVQLNQEECVSHFLQSLYANFGILHDVNQQKRLRSFLPVMVITSLDGYTICSWKEKDGIYSDEWSEKKSFYRKENGKEYEFFLGAMSDYVRIWNEDKGRWDDGHRLDLWKKYRDWELLKDEKAFEQVRRQTIIEALETAMQEQLTDYQKNMGKAGLKFQFSLPVIPNEEWYRTVDDIGILAVYQDYHQQYLLAGSRSHKREDYIWNTKNGNGQLQPLSQ